MTINLNKILTVSADEYLRCVHKNISEYDLRGVHQSVEDNKIQNFAKAVPYESEIVTSLKYGVGSTQGFDTVTKIVTMISGTALIPKKEIKE